MDGAPTLTSQELESLAGDITQQHIHRELLDAMQTTALTTLGLGAGLRGAQGLYSLVTRNLKPPRSPNEDLVMAVPTARKRAARELTQADCDRFHQALKRALGQDKSAAWSDWFTQPLQHTQDLFGGQAATSLQDYPLAGAGLTAAGLVGLAGGYGLTDHLLNARKQIVQQREEEDAQAQYEQALQQLVRPPAKTAAARTLGEDLSLLYEHVKSATDLGGALLNVAGTTWPLLALLGGTLAYGMTRSRQPGRLLDKAVARRQRQQLLNEPLYAFPDYRPGKTPPAKAPEEPLDLDPQVAEALAAGRAA